MNDQSVDSVFSPEEAQKIVDRMNKELDLYIPAGVKEYQETHNYKLLFFYLRKLFYLVKGTTKEEVTEYFTNFYHTPETEKTRFLVKLENTVNSRLTDQELFSRVEKENLVNNLKDYLVSLPNDKKASFLYAINEGEVPNKNTDISKYQAIVDEDLRQQQEYSNQIQQQQNYGQVLSSEAIADKYLNNADLRYSRSSTDY